MSQATRQQGISEPPTSATEYAAIQNCIDNWLLPRKPNRAQLHIYEMCERLQCSDKMTEKPPSVYPYGHKGVCEYCLHKWRRGHPL